MGWRAKGRRYQVSRLFALRVVGGELARGQARKGGLKKSDPHQRRAHLCVVESEEERCREQGMESMMKGGRVSKWWSGPRKACDCSIARRRCAYSALLFEESGTWEGGSLHP